MGPYLHLMLNSGKPSAIFFTCNGKMIPAYDARNTAESDDSTEAVGRVCITEIISVPTKYSQDCATPLSKAHSHSFVRSLLVDRYLLNPWNNVGVSGPNGDDHYR